MMTIDKYNINALAIKAKTDKLIYDELFLFVCEYMKNTYIKYNASNMDSYHQELLNDLPGELYIYFARIIKNFNPNKDTNFLTYCRWWFRPVIQFTEDKFKSSISLHFREQGYNSVSFEDLLMIPQAKTDNEYIQKMDLSHNNYKIDKYLSSLTDKEKFIYIKRHTENLQFPDITKLYNKHFIKPLTNNRIIQLHQSAEKKLLKYKK